ncbi:MAG: DUF1343 domain-containing protein [Flavobacteriales bacterium]|nr:DUF1343 domain-containing protein [Flavobacteriales bacterium]
MTVMMLAKNSVRFLVLVILIACTGIGHDSAANEPFIIDRSQAKLKTELILGAERTESYIPLIKGKAVAVVANHTSMVGSVHLIDTLIALGVDLKHVYAPEHGFRGDRDAGAHIEDEKDQKTGLPIFSLHGRSKKPSPGSLNGIDVVLFDIQDVGVRFYTYISTLHYVMEACAENGIELIVLDRPNPHASYVDGPVLQREFSSFVGMHPVPVVYGMTIGEYARMILGEKWIEASDDLELKVIPCLNYTHNTEYSLPIPPSPNLPDNSSVILYPSLCFFEGTVVSIGRGTDHPFQVVGHPLFSIGSHSFTPQSNYGAKHPKLEGKSCFGQFLGEGVAEVVQKRKQLDLSYLIGYHDFLCDKIDFFSERKFFDKLAGTDELRVQLVSGMKEEDIKKTWHSDIEAFKTTRAKYLIYP